MIVRIYRLTPAEGQAEAAREALAGLASLVGDAPGCLDAAVFTDLNAGGDLLFLERWRSEAAYEAAKARLPRTAFSSLAQTLRQPPQLTVLQKIPPPDQ